MPCGLSVFRSSVMTHALVAQWLREYQLSLDRFGGAVDCSQVAEHRTTPRSDSFRQMRYLVHPGHQGRSNRST